jgi:regulator of replication initiation timing
VSFSLWYNTDVVREIYIDISSLKDKIEDYISESSYRVLNKAIILKIITQKQKQLEIKANLAQYLKEQLGADIGHYILVGGLANDDIGVVKNITIVHDDKLRVEYSALKKDLSESKASTKTTDRSNIFFVVKSEEFGQDLKTNALKNKDQVIRLYKERLSTKGSKRTRKK